jgi:hypothetical protein
MLNHLHDETTYYAICYLSTNTCLFAYLTAFTTGP